MLLAGTTALSGTFGWFAMWSSYVSSDEGYLILSLREWVARGHLYDQVYSQYGPFYYLVFGLPSRVAGTAWTVAGGRFTSLILWMATSFLLGLATWRLTRRLGFGVAAQVLTFSLLTTLVNEPMHPGGILCFLLATLVANITVLRPRSPVVSDLLSGGLLAALTLTKANVGGFAILAVIFVVVEALPSRARLWRAGGLAAFVALGPLLLFSNGVRDWKVLLAVVYVVAAVSVAMASGAWRTRDPASRTVSVPWILAGALTVASVTTGFALITGTSLPALIRGVVVRPLRFSTTVTVPLELPPAAWAWLVVLPLGVIAARQLLDSKRPDVAGLVSGLVRIVGGAALIAFVLGSPATFDFLVPPEAARFSLLPVAALALVPRVATTRARAGDLLARRFLCAAAVTESLHAYPVPGSQLSWSLMLASLCGVVAVSDGVSEILDARHLTADTIRSRVGVAAAGFVLAIPLVIPNGLTGGAGLPGRQFADWVGQYQDHVAMALPGTGRVRRPLGEQAAITRIVGALNQSCSTFVPLWDLHYYVLTGLPPPTGFNAPLWYRLLTGGEQEDIVRALERRSRVCLLLTAPAEHVVDGRLRLTIAMSRGPLVRYLAGQRWDPVTVEAGIQVFRRAAAG